MSESPLRRLYKHARHHRGRLAAAVFFSITNKLLDLAPPVLIGAAVDVVVRKEESFLGAQGITDLGDQLLLVSGLTVLVWVLESATEYLHQWFWRNLAQTVQHELRGQAYTHIQDLDMSWFADQARGDLMAVLNDDINQLERFLDGGANAILQVVTTAIAVSFAFVSASPELAAWAVAPIPFILAGSFWFQGTITPHYDLVRKRAAQLNALLSNNLEGIATIKSFTAEAHEAERVSQASEAYRQANKKAIALSSAFSPLIRMLVVVGFTATLFVGGQRVLDGVLTAATYSTLIYLTQRLLWPLTRLGTTFDLYQRAMASTRRVLNLVETEIEVRDGEQGVGDAGQGDIVFDAVHFAYPGRDPVLQDFSLHIKAGSTVAIVGSTGSGKSTLIRLLLRFFDPAQGNITLGGHDLRALRMSELRGALSMVGQQVFLFPGSVRENIAYGSPDASLADIEEAASLAEASAFIAELPQGLDSEIGESGQKLSGGQRQRLSIARAVLKAAPILILDEATSAVDNDTEAAIQRSLFRISQDRTTVIIAHRLSTIRHADEIVVMEAGRIIERGTHEALVEQDGTYARLWRVQTGESTPSGAEQMETR